jgi:hypothetical protein
MTTNFNLSIDWDRNNNFTGTHDNITNRVMWVNWYLGSKKPYQDTSDNPMCGIVLRNDDRLYSPDNTGSPLAGKLVPQRPVRIQSFDGTTTRLAY